MNNVRIAGHVVSASMMIVASQAMARLSDHAEKIYSPEAGDVDPDTRSRILSAVTKRDFKLATAELVPLVARSFGEDGVSLSNLLHLAQVQDSTNPPGYLGDPSSESWAVGVTPSYTGGCYTNCYSNCHSNCYANCHGSRGWR